MPLYRKVRASDIAKLQDFCYYHLMERRKPHKIFFIWLIGGVTLFSACEQRPKKALTPTQYKPITVRDAVINYLALPDFTLPDFQAQTIGTDARFERVNRRRGLLYFSVPRPHLHDQNLINLVTDTSCIEYGVIDGRQMKLGRVSTWDTSRLLIRFPDSLLLLDTTRVLTRDFGSASYRIPLPELRDLMTARGLYNSPALFVVGYTDDGRQRVIANHAAPIARYGVPSLTDLVWQLTDSTQSMEMQAQALLDFVTQKIEYREYDKYEVFLKPHEVILSGRGDCSGKVVLFSSLLHQAQIPHLLVYQKAHICVAIPGDFPSRNGMSFEHQGQIYFIAETTVRGFRIGHTRFYPPSTPETFQYLQYPGKQTKLFDLSKQDSLPFATRRGPA